MRSSGHTIVPNVSEEVLGTEDEARLVTLLASKQKKNEKQRSSRQANRNELKHLEQAKASAEVLGIEDEARLETLLAGKQKNNENKRVIRHAYKRQKTQVTCVDLQHPYKLQELDNSDACTMCNKFHLILDYFIINNILLFLFRGIQMFLLDKR